jgi:tetratricopeptide (TPR) repeat protein
MQSDAVKLSGFDRAWVELENHKKQVAWAGAGLVILGLLAWFFVWNRQENEVRAAEALSLASSPQLGQPGSPPNSAESYLKVAAEYPEAKAGVRALLLAGGAYFVEGKFAEAKTQFEKFARQHRESPLVGQALLGIAACHEAQGNTNEAVTAYKNLVDRHSNESFILQAKFALARLYEAQNKPEMAQPLYEEVARGDSYGMLGSEAGMRFEELRIKYPHLVPPVAPTVSPIPGMPAAPPPAGSTNAGTNALPFKIDQP